MLRGLPHPLLSVSWGNMTSHVSKLWHEESQMRLKPSKHLLPKLILKLLRQGFGLTSRRSWSFPWWISGWRPCSRGEVFLYIQRCKYWGSFEKWHILFGEKRGWIVLTKKESCLLAPSARANVLSQTKLLLLCCLDKSLMCNYWNQEGSILGGKPYQVQGILL